MAIMTDGVRTVAARPRQIRWWVGAFWAGVAATLLPWTLGSGAEFLNDPITGIGRVAGLVSGYLIAVQLLLMSGRARHSSTWHRWIGGTVFAFLVAHLVFITFGYAAGASVVDQTWNFIRGYPWLLAAYVAFALFTMVGLTSIRALKRRLRYETWYHLHLYTYLAAALAFTHQITAGADLTGLTTWFWILLYGSAFAVAIWGRLVRPLRLTMRHRFRVSRVVAEAPGVASVHIAGRHLRGLNARPGQFFRFRFLARNAWWQAHPFSLSAAPGADGLRITVKALGDHTRDLQTLPAGTRVIVEGPYGDFTADSRVNDKVVLVAAGIGITPIRALLEDLPPGAGRAVVIYRARSESEIVFADELRELAYTRGAHLIYLLGDDHDRRSRDALTPRGLRQLVPDIADRDAFVCGPPGLVRHLRGVLSKLDVRQVHLDPFEL
ncbi:ferredoxin reductase family protein [Nonomuraea endophytica]|uniref:ferredoxin reductase family protein n=1 Tax=Nonomuraea endophytica TaxID=714136 RepID=UPI0037CA9802